MLPHPLVDAEGALVPQRLQNTRCTPTRSMPTTISANTRRRTNTLTHPPTHARTDVHVHGDHRPRRRYVVPADEGRAGLACFAPTSESLVAGGANAMLYLWDLGSEVMGRVAEMPPSANSGEQGSLRSLTAVQHYAQNRKRKE